jgi:hypothetical protein
MYLHYIFSLELHTHGFIVVTSLTHPRKIILVALQIEQEVRKAKHLSAPLRIICMESKL